VVVAALAVVAATSAVLTSVTLFPYLSVNQDETVYLLQADSLRAGHLFPPAPPAEGDAFVPWLSVVSGDRYVPKYSPVWPSMIAAGRLLTGSQHAAQAVVAAGVVVVTYLLARQVLGRRWPAVLASVFLLLSPFFLVQSATFLSYLPNLLLLEGFAVALLAGVRRRSPPLLVLSGLLLGLAAFARPYDAVLFAMPFGAWLLFTRRHALRKLFSEAGWLLGGLIPPLLATLAFFRAATGSPFRSPFNLLDKSDTLGFGAKSVFSWQPRVDYGAKQAWHGLLGNSLLLSFWCFGGLVLIGLAVVALRRRTTGLEPWLGLVALTIPVGYLVFWGSDVVSRWEGPWRVGPFYYLPVLAPLAVLGAGGFARLWRFDRRLSGLALVGMVSVSGLVLVRTLDAQAEASEGLRALHAPLEENRLDHAIVFLPRYVPQLMVPFSRARNPSFDQEVVWALDRGDEANLRALDLFPTRKPYLLTEGAPGVLYELARHRGRTVTAEVELRPPPTRGTRIEKPSLVLGVGRGERLETFPLRVEDGLGDEPLRIRLVIGGDGVRPEGRLGPPRTERRTPGPNEPDVLLWLLRTGARDEAETDLAGSGFDIRPVGDEVEVLLPARPALGPEDAPSLEVFADPGRPEIPPLVQAVSNHPGDDRPA
jgi:4-amino-4-deoxy-L-arabinose transferase-like glycosyltransferase